MNFLLLLPILIPLLFATLCLFAWGDLSWQRGLSLVGGLLFFAAAIVLLVTVRAEGIQTVQLGNWPAPFGITLIADLFSAVMVAVTGLIGLMIVIYSLFGVDDQRQSYGYHPILHFLFVGVCGAFLTGDLFNMYVWFEVMLIASFVLVALGGERAQLEGAVKYVTLNLISSALFLAAAGVLYSTVGTLNMADLASQLSQSDENAVPTIAAAILMIAFGNKAAVFPLFFWLPASYNTPPAAVSAVMAGLLTKVGVYALVRMHSLMFAYDVANTQVVLIGIAAATMVTGVLGAAAQHEFRRILSFHIISQIGYMIMGLAIFTPLSLAGMVFYLVHHIIVKTNLFLIAGIVNLVDGSYDLHRLGGLYRNRMWLAVLFLIPAMSLAGLPPLSGFWAKLLLVRAGLESQHYALTTVALAVSLLTLYSMTKIWHEVFWKEMDPPAATTPSDRRPVNARVLGGMVLPVVGLAICTVGIGVFVEPLLAIAMATADQIFDPSQYIAAVLSEN